MVGSRWVATASLVALVLIGASCDADDGRAMRTPTLGERIDMVPPPTTTTTTVAVSTDTTPTTVGAADDEFGLTVSLALDDVIDIDATCLGDDRPPAMTWTTPPSGTIELAVLVRDQSAEDLVHWVVTGIEPTAGRTPEALAGSVEGVNGLGEVGWSGPCPAPGDPTHTYRFQLLALPAPLSLPTPFTVEDLYAVVSPDPIAVAEQDGTYPG